MRARQARPSKQAEVIEAAATIVLAWRRGLRPVADLVLGEPYVFDPVESLVGSPVTSAPRSKLRERALREGTAAAIDIVLAGSIARRVIRGVRSIHPTVLSRAASLAKRVATGRGIQKVVTDAVDRVERELGTDGVRVAVESLATELSRSGRLSPREIEGMVGDRLRQGWAWWRNLTNPLLGGRWGLRECRRSRSPWSARG